MSRVSSVPSPLVESVSPLVWGSSPNNRRSTPIAIVRNNSNHLREESDSDDDDAIHSFQQLVLEDQDAIHRFRVGSLPSATARRLHALQQNQQHFGTSLPAAPVLTSRRNRPTISIPEFSLAGGSGVVESSSPSYGSLRESQLAGRFLDGPSSYRDSSGQIKWHQKVRFQSQPQQMSLEDRMQELREQQQQQGQDGPLSSMLATSVTLHDQDSFLHKEDAHLSTSLTGLELLQRGLSTDLPDASHVSSFSSSNVTYDAPTHETCNGTYEASIESLPAAAGDYYDLEEEDDSPVFDLDME